jgi:hypothetical protein
MQPCLTRLTVAAIAVVGFLTLSPRASAEIIDLELTGIGGGSATIEFKGTPMLRPLGAFSWKDTNVDQPNPSFPPTIKTFCIELEQGLPTLTPPTATFKVTDPAAAPTLNAAKADAIRALYGNFYDAQNDKVIDGKDRAFQIALWEIVYDLGSASGLNLSNGDFAYNVPSATLNDANTMLSGLSGGLANFNASGYELVALVAPAGPDAKPQDQVQDHVTIRPRGAPAPPGLLLAGVGALALLGRARWNRRAPGAA